MSHSNAYRPIRDIQFAYAIQKLAHFCIQRIEWKTANQIMSEWTSHRLCEKSANSMHCWPFFGDARISS